jgi:hypothetical protein
MVRTARPLKQWRNPLQVPGVEQPDCVIWVESENVEANDYNPNAVAPPEMELLKNSILEDGYTQPVVTFQEEGKHVVVDGFHRTRAVQKERCRDFHPDREVRTKRSVKPKRRSRKESARLEALPELAARVREIVRSCVT